QPAVRVDGNPSPAASPERRADLRGLAPAERAGDLGDVRLATPRQPGATVRRAQWSADIEAPPVRWARTRVVVIEGVRRGRPLRRASAARLARGSSIVAAARTTADLGASRLPRRAPRALRATAPTSPSPPACTGIRPRRVPTGGGSGQTPDSSSR